MKIRGGNSAIFINGNYSTESDTGCPRKILLRAAGVEETHGQGTLNVFALGHHFETWFAEKVPHAERERKIETENFIGHMDFIDDEFIYETKSVSSSKTSTHIKKAPKYQHLFQLATYLIMAERQKGKLVYGDYSKQITYPKLLKLEPEIAQEKFDSMVPVLTEFLVEISDDGIFYVNGEPTFLEVKHILDFQEALLSLKEDELPPRPEMLPVGNSDPCGYCPLKYLCDSNPSSRADFIDQAKEIIDNTI